MRTKNLAKKDMARLACIIFSLAPLSAFAGLSELQGVAPDKPIKKVLADMTTWILGFGILLCVILIIWGGITYVASVGDEQRIEKSKKTIHYAIYGIAIIGLSYAMIKVVNDVLITNNQ
jgi:fumarate reductase subunit D